MRQHSALILKPETDSRGVQRAAFNVRTVVQYLEYYHRIRSHYENGVTSGTSIFGIYQYAIPNRSKGQEISSEIPFEFKKRCVEISITYECNFKRVKICQKCAYFESGLLSEKLLRIKNVAQNRTSC